MLGAIDAVDVEIRGGADGLCRAGANVFDIATEPDLQATQALGDAELVGRFAVLGELEPRNF